MDKYKQYESVFERKVKAGIIKKPITIRSK
jgi:hypothetical protein